MKKHAFIGVAVAALLSLGGCSYFQGITFTHGLNSIGMQTASYVFNLERFDKTATEETRFQFTVEPRVPASATQLPPVGVSIRTTAAGGKQVDISYIEATTRDLSDFQVGLNGFSYTGANHRIDVRYMGKTDQTYVVRITVDPISAVASSLPPVNVSYKPTETGGVVIVASWTQQEAEARAKAKLSAARKASPRKRSVIKDDVTSVAAPIRRS